MLRCGVGTPTPCINFLFSSSSCTRCFNRSERHTIQGCLFDEKPRETCNNCRSYNQRQSGVRALPKYVGWSETAHQRLLPSSDVQCRYCHLAQYIVDPLAYRLFCQAYLFSATNCTATKDDMHSCAGLQPHLSWGLAICFSSSTASLAAIFVMG